MSKSSPQRKQNRAALKQVKKRVVQSAGSPSPTNPLEVPHLRRLEADLEQLGSAFNHNAQLYNHALTIAEMRLRVLERVMNDQLNGRTLLTMEAEGQKLINFEAYNTELACCMVMAGFAHWLKSLADAHAATDNPPLIYQPGYDDTTVFGGGP